MSQDDKLCHGGDCVPTSGGRHDDLGPGVGGTGSMVNPGYVRELRAAGFTSYTRAEFLRRVSGAGIGLVAGAGLLSLAGCGSSQSTAPETLAEVERPRLTIGFIPINCATPIIMAAPLGIYSKYGLDVTVKKFSGWPEIRDAAIAGEIDAAHLLSPIPIATSMGVGSQKAALRLAAIENINGQALTIAKKHLGKVERPSDMKGMKLAIPFEFSMHNLLLRHYLASGGVDPDRDVQLMVLRPPDMVAGLAVQNIDGFFGPEPMNQRAVYEGAGYIHMLSKDIWDGHPCCSFSVRQEFIDQNPRTYQALLQAIVDATHYSQQAENREKIAEAIAPREYLNQPAEVVKAALTGHFDNGKGNLINDPQRIGFDPYPWKDFAVWIETQLIRWGYIKREEAKALNYKAVADEVFRTRDVREMQRKLGFPATYEEYKTEMILGQRFDASSPAPWLEPNISARL